MKRSDIKRYLIDKIDNKWDIPWEDFGDPCLNKDEFADNILSWLEEAGMLPPVRNADLKSSYGWARVYEWETE